MTDGPGIKTAIVLTLGFAIVVFATMALLQRKLDDDYRFGKPCPTYTAASMMELAKHKQIANYVIIPLLFPLDLLFLASASAALALVSIAYAHGAGVSFSFAWLLLFPALYLVSDFTENALLAGMLSGRTTITDGIVELTHLITNIKWLTITLAGLQAAAIFVMAWTKGQLA